MSDPQWQLETLAVHGGYRPDPTTRAVAVPIYQTVAYAFDDTQHGADLFDLKVPGNIYTRIMNPTTDVLEQRPPPGRWHRRTGAGLGAGRDHLCHPDHCRGRRQHRRLQRAVWRQPQPAGAYAAAVRHPARFADPADPTAFAALIDERTKAVFVESIGNPRGNVTDIAAIAEVAHAAGVP